MYKKDQNLSQASNSHRTIYNRLKISAFSPMTVYYSKMWWVIWYVVVYLSFECVNSQIILHEPIGECNIVWLFTHERDRYTTTYHIDESTSCFYTVLLTSKNKHSHLLLLQPFFLYCGAWIFVTFQIFMTTK